MKPSRAADNLTGDTLIFVDSQNDLACDPKYIEAVTPDIVTTKQPLLCSTSCGLYALSDCHTAAVENEIPFRRQCYAAILLITRTHADC